MKELKVLSLFSGIGAFEKAIEDLGLKYKLVNYCEIDKDASKSYSIIHDVSENINLWDITKINIEELANDIDLLTHGSPCQSFSSCGKQEGGDKGSGTQSSLMWNTVEIIRHCKPKYVIWENVKNVISKTHRHNFDKYIDELNGIGYKSYHKVLNSEEFNIPHNRPRIFVVSILGEHTPYEFPKRMELTKEIKDVLIDCEDYIGMEISPAMKPGCYKEFEKHYINIINSDKKIYDCKAKSDFQDKKVGIKVSPCLRASSSNTHILDNNNCIRKITEKECWNLMGFGTENYEKVKQSGISRTQMHKQIGNSIDVEVIKNVIDKLISR